MRAFFKEQLGLRWWVHPDRTGRVTRPTPREAPRLSVIDHVSKTAFDAARITFVCMALMELGMVASFLTYTEEMSHPGLIFPSVLFTVGFFASLNCLIACCRLNGLARVVGSPRVMGIYFDWDTTESAAPATEDRSPPPPPPGPTAKTDYEVLLPDDGDEMDRAA